jgi:molecular chaperone GrpE (heat shock protein)
MLLYMMPVRLLNVIVERVRLTSFTNLDTQLADRTSKLHAVAAATSTSSTPRQSDSQSIPAPLVAPSKKQLSSESGSTPTDLLNTARAELSEAQRSRYDLQDRLNRASKELEKLHRKGNLDDRRINTLENEKVHLQLRLKDRDAELKGKAKLLEVSSSALLMVVI